jgi:hypothetical protein
MEFRIADTFTDSLTRLTGEEQKAVKTTAFDLQNRPGRREPAASLPIRIAVSDRFTSTRVSLVLAYF